MSIFGITNSMSIGWACHYKLHPHTRQASILFRTYMTSWLNIANSKELKFIKIYHKYKELVTSFTKKGNHPHFCSIGKFTSITDHLCILWTLSTASKMEYSGGHQSASWSVTISCCLNCSSWYFDWPTYIRLDPC